MKKYLEKRLEELNEEKFKQLILGGRMEDATIELRINESLVKELIVRISETESSLSYCKENRKPIFLDVDKSMNIIEGLLANIDSEINADSNYYNACQIAYNSLLQLQIQQKEEIHG